MTETLPFECSYEHACRIEPDYECLNTNCELNPMHEPEKPECFEQRTCGNCGHSLRASCTSTCTHKPGVVKYTCHITKEACENWIPGGSIEQRYEQLEQVAKEMLGYLSAIKYGTSPLQLTRDTERFRSSLKALGVVADESRY